jgi:hypothetical protein
MNWGSRICVNFAPYSLEMLSKKEAQSFIAQSTCIATKIFHLCIPEKELCGRGPNYHINVSVSDLYIPRIGKHLHCNENSIYVFPEKELRGLSPNFHIYMFVSNIYISQDRLTYFPAAEYRLTDPLNI